MAKRGDYRGEYADFRKRFGKIVRNHGDFRGARESGTQGFQHGWRKIQGHKFGFGTRQLDELQQSPTAAPNIQNAIGCGGRNSKRVRSPSTRWGMESARPK
jgi:hypothetical protein